MKNLVDKSLIYQIEEFSLKFWWVVSLWVDNYILKLIYGVTFILLE